MNINLNIKRSLTAAMLLAMLAPPAIAAPRDGKSTTDRDAAIAEKWIAAWNSHSPEKMLPVFTDDVFYEDVAFGEVSHGSAELRKFAASEFEGVPDLELKLLRANVQGGHGTIEWVFSGTDKGVFNTGKKFSVRGVSVIDVRDGKISRSVDFYDSGTIMRQVGVLPAEAVSGKAVLEAYVSAWNRHDSAALDKLLTPDAVHEDIAWPSRDEGPAQIKKFMQEMIALEPDFDWRLTNIIDSGSAVAAEWTWTATYTGDCPTVGHVVGMHASGRGASVAVIENGRIKRFADYYDFASFCREGSAQKSK